MKIPIFQIKVNDGRREVDQDAVHGLADSITEVGLMNPIIVDKEYTLIAGLHRLEAAKLLGWTEIESNVSSLEGLLADLAEIDENIVRKGLTDDEYDEMLLRRKEIYEALHPETKHGGDRKSEKIKMQNLQLDSAKSFIQDTAEKMRVSPRTVAARLQTAKNLTPEAKTIIRDSDTKITKTNALKLSRLSPEQQKEAATQLASGSIRSVDEYHPDQDRAESAEEQTPAVPTPLHEAPASLSRTGYYPTIRDSAADLKNPDKDRSITPDTFLVSFSLFLQRFCQSVNSYADNEFAPVFPALTKEHLDQVQQEIVSVHNTLDDFLILLKGSQKDEQT